MIYTLTFLAVRLQVTKAAAYYLACLGPDALPAMRGFLRAPRAERRTTAYIWDRLGS
jgi:hypothetical protein